MIRKFNLKAETDLFNQTITRKAVIRYLVIIVDLSFDCTKNDIRPTRGTVVKELVKEFVLNFAD